MKRSLSVAKGKFSIIALLALCVTIGFAGTAQAYDYRAKFLQECEWLATQQAASGGVWEGEDYTSVVETDNTAEAIWIWSRYAELTGDYSTYLTRINNAWTYCNNNPSWLEGGALTNPLPYYSTYNIGWGLLAEMKYRHVYGGRPEYVDHTSYGTSCADALVNYTPSTSNATNALCIGIACGALHQYGVDVGNATYRTRAATLGNTLRTWLEADTSRFSADSTWAIGSGIGVWGILNSYYQENSGGATWATTYAPYMPLDSANNATNSYEFGHDGWYVWGYYAVSQVLNSGDYFQKYRNLVDLILDSDEDLDGGIRQGITYANTSDYAWSTDIMQFGLNYGLTSTVNYTISGTITSGGSPLAGVKMVGLPNDVVTDANGFYTTQVPAGFYCTVAPSKTGYAFSPANIVYSNVASNQTGQNYSTTVASLETIELDAVSSNSSATSSSTLSWNHTVGSGNNRLLVVGVACESSTASYRIVSTIKFNGVNMTRVWGDIREQGSNRTDLWYMLDPPVGTYQVLVTYNGSVSYRAGGAISLRNVKQQPYEAVARNSLASATAISTNITTLTNGAWVTDVVCHGNSGSFTTSTSAEQWDRNTGYHTGAGATKAVATAGSTALDWTFSGSAGAMTHSLLAFAPSETTSPQPPGKATGPNPANSATSVSITADLSWSAGSGATSHDVYFGTSSPGIFQINQTGTTFDPCTLSNNTTYYWRIDEINANGTTTGDVWSFTTDTGKATSPNPADSATGVSITADLSWSGGPDATSHNVYFGTSSSPPFIQNQAGTTFDTGTMANSTTYYWRIDEINASGTITGDVWSFTTASLPGQASSPSPANSATGVSETADLSWTAGSSATSHDVYFGTSSSPPFIQNQAGTTYDTGTMANSTTYYWRIDEVGPGGTTTGTVWSFTTMAAPVVYNYSGITSPSSSHKAEDGEIDVLDSDIQNGTFGARRDSIAGWALWAEATTAEYANLVGSDNSYYQGADPGNSDNAAMIFEFYVAENPTDIQQINLTLELGRGASTDLGYVYIWNYNTSSYLVLGTQSGTADQVLSYSITTNPGDYVDPSTGQVTVFVVNMDDSDWIRVDNIAVSIYAQTAPPGQATSPNPSDTATGVSITADLSWTAGSGATSHDVYFGTSSPGTFQINQTGTTFDPGTLSNNTTYYWRIDEVGAGGTTTGTVWSFTTVSGVTQRTLTTSSTTGGDVTTPGEGAYNYDHGTNASIVATADAHYHFVNWTGTGVTAGKVANPNAASTTITMDADYTAVANFAIDQFTLTYTAGANGSIDGTSPQTVDYGTDGSAVTAVADTGYHFVNWSDSSTDNPRTDTGVTADITVTANFAIDLPVDNFNDNRRGAMWRQYDDSNDSLWLVEDVNVLNMQASGEMPLTSCAGHWKMNDNAANTTVADSSGNGKNGTAQQNTSVLHTTGKIDGALTFNGTSDYVNIGNVIGTGAYTKVAWIKTDTGSYNNNIVSSSTLSHALWAPASRGGRLMAGHADPGAPDYDHVQDSEALQPSVWYHVAVTFDPAVDSGRMVLYKNGSEVDSATNVPTQIASPTVYIGRFYSGYSFKGSIDNVMIFNRALTAEEIQALYNEGNGTETIPGGTPEYASAGYAANRWTLDASGDFEVKVDYHYSGTSNRDGWVGMSIENNADNYVALSAGHDSNGPFFYYEKAVDGSVTSGQIARGSNDGTLYISYNASSDELYLSSTGYGSANAWQTISGLLQGQWASTPVRVTLDGVADRIVVGPGEAYLDNFEVTTATLNDWPVITDLNNDGYIDWEDISLLADNWLNTNPEAVGDIVDDDVVNFLDFAEIGLDW